MDSDRTYWFEQPYLPGSYNIAVQPFVGTDGRLHFSVPYGKYWALTGNLIKNEGNYFEFCCDDAVMGARGGTYKFTILTLDKIKDSRWIPEKNDVLRECQTDEALYQWYREHWPNERIRRDEKPYSSKRWTDAPIPESTGNRTIFTEDEIRQSEKRLEKIARSFGQLDDDEYIENGTVVKKSRNDNNEK